jgi:poly(3-hydroxybutyrate) depolymerase
MSVRTRKGMASLAIAAVVALTLPAAASAAGEAGAGRVDSGAYSTMEGTYPWLAYVPAGWKKGDHWPLYVMLHGCATTPREQMMADAMNPIADREHVILLYVDTISTGRAGPAVGESGGTGGAGECWRGALGVEVTSEMRGGGGDADAIAALTRLVTSSYTIDPERVYVIGMSAGAFEAPEVAAAYPDIFAAAGVNSGGGIMGAGCAAMTDDVVPFYAQVEVSQMGARAHPMPFFSIGGTGDQLGEASAPGGCARLAFKQWMASDNILMTGDPNGNAYTQDKTATRTGTVPGGHPWTRYLWRDRSGCEIGERWVVDGMGHFWSGGSSDPQWATWTDPKGPSTSAESLRFFLQFTRSDGNTSCSANSTPAAAPSKGTAKHKKKRHHRKSKHKHRKHHTKRKAVGRR